MPFHSGCGWLSSSLAPSTLRRSRLNPLNFGRIHKEIWASLDLPPWIPNERAHINTAQYRLRGHRGCVNCLALAPDGSLLLSAGDDTLLGVWSPWSFINRECAAFTLFDQQEPPSGYCGRPTCSRPTALLAPPNPRVDDSHRPSAEHIHCHAA